LGYIPYKGAVLNQLAAFWFGKTKHIVANHIISLPDPNVLVAKNCTPIPIEMIVRGYMSGVTKTSIWYSYQKGERTIYGIHFPDGLQKNDKLPKPVITPTTHGGGVGGHDERLTKKEIIERKLIDKKTYEQMEKAVLKLFAFGSNLAEKQGLILVDTKYEFGLVNGKLTLMDEIHTPDSSRFWIKKTYKQKLSSGEEPEICKERTFTRIWKTPKMTDDNIMSMSVRRNSNIFLSIERIQKQTFKIKRFSR
jgi:phosphoribosylaminoimidazole-succinocarboxamide synthase